MSYVAGVDSDVEVKIEGKRCAEYEMCICRTVLLFI